MAKRKKTNAVKDKSLDDCLSLGRVIRTKPTPRNNIRNWRIFLKIKTHQQLADLTLAKDPFGKGLDRGLICRLENGSSRYNEDHLTLISLATGVAPHDLIGTNPFNAGDIFAVYSGLSERDKLRAMKAIKALNKPPKPRK